MPQNPYYPTGITLFDYLSSVFFKNGWKWFLSNDENKKIFNVLNELELSDKKFINIENLSGGELQKANIALGLLSGADFFLLDEPSSNMDLINSVKILKTLKKLTENGITSVIIMHDLALALKYCDNFLCITNKQKVVQKSQDEIYNIEILKSIFNINFEIINKGNSKYVEILD